VIYIAEEFIFVQYFWNLTEREKGGKDITGQKQETTAAAIKISINEIIRIIITLIVYIPIL
jgi:hypothetical protein